MTAAPPLDRYLTAREAWEMLGLGRTVFWRKVHEGTIPAKYYGGRSYRFKLSDLDAAGARLAMIARNERG